MRMRNTETCHLSPSLVPLALGRILSPRLVKIGSPQFRKLIVNLLPFQSVQNLRQIVSIMDMAARRIITERKEALRSGEDAVLQQIGEGKDILSRLREYIRKFYRSSADLTHSPRQHGKSRR